MWFAIWAEDVEDSLAKRKSAREAHLARLKELQEQGRLFVAGPCPLVAAEDVGDIGFSGSLIIADFDDQETAQTWADADPYIAAGVYDKVTIKPFKIVLPA